MAADPQRPAAGYGSARRRGLRALVIRQRRLELPQRRLGRQGLRLLVALQRLLQLPLRDLDLRVLIVRQRLLQLPQRRRSLCVLRHLPRVHDLYVTVSGTKLPFFFRGI